MRPEPKCVIDRSRACGACVASGPAECPYAYLLEPDELAAVVAASHRDRPQARRDPWPHAPAGTVPRDL